VNKNYYIRIKNKSYIDNKRKEQLFYKYENFQYVKDILSLNNKYKILIDKR